MVFSCDIFWRMIEEKKKSKKDIDSLVEGVMKRIIQGLNNLTEWNSRDVKREQF